MCEKRFYLDMEFVPNGKRFYLDMELVTPSIVDLSDGTPYPIEDEGIFEDVVKLLNEVETERIAYRDKFENCKRNFKKINEQQDLFRVRFEQEDGRGEIVNEKGVELTAREVVDCLNTQQDTIITLRRRLEKINGGYGHLTHRNGLTANEWVIESQEKELKKKNEQISDWIEQHSKDIVKIGEQQATINHLKQELEEYKKNWDDMVELATKTSLRNIELDEQIGQLKAQLREKEEDERLYANEIVKLNKEAKEVLDFKSLGGDY